MPTAIDKHYCFSHAPVVSGAGFLLLSFLGRLDLANEANENLCVDYNGQARCEGGWRTAEQR